MQKNVFDFNHYILRYDLSNLFIKSNVNGNDNCNVNDNSNGNGFRHFFRSERLGNGEGTIRIF